MTPPLRVRGVKPAMRAAIRGFRLPDLLLLLVGWAPLLFAWSPYLVSYPRLVATYGGPFELSVLLGDTLAHVVRTPHPYLVSWIPLGLAGLALRQLATALVLRRVVASREAPRRGKALLRVAACTLLTIVCLGSLNAALPPSLTGFWAPWMIVIGFSITRYALVVPVLMAEDGGVRYAFRRSVELTKQCRIGLFLVRFWLVVVPVVLLAPLYFLQPTDRALPPLVFMLVYAFAAVFQAGFLGHLYRQAAGRESRRIEQVFR